MGQITVTKGGTVTGGTIMLFTFPAATIPSGQELDYFTITIPGADRSYTGWGLRNDSAVLQLGDGKKNTNTTALHWNNGGSAKIWLFSSTTRACTLVLTFYTKAITTFTITTNVSGGHGTLTANKSTSAAGVTITLTPTPATGYELKSYSTSPSVTITSNKFVMPASNITITATFQLKSYAITKKTSPTGAGTVTTKVNGTAVTTGKMGQTITVEQTPAAGFFFDGWTTNPTNLISNGSFVMPAQAVTITANYLQRSTASVNKTSLTGGSTVTLTITPDSSSFSHKYQLSFGTGMSSELTAVAAGTTSVTINVPDTWSEAIPDDESKTGGTLTVYTFNGETEIGSYEITGLTYLVPDSAVPDLDDIITAVARVIGGITYADVGNYYVQSHCGVEVTTSAEGALGSTIESISVNIGGYTGAGYSDTVMDDELDFTSGLLTVPGQTVITVTAEDSRGRTSTATVTITVTQYSPPTGTIAVNRAKLNGDDDDLGSYGKYVITKGCTQVGTNSVTASITSQGVTETVQFDTGDLLPTTRQMFDTQQEYTITLTLQDAFETTIITTILQTAKFIIHVDAQGNSIAFMKAVTQSVPAGKESTVEFSADSQIYIGNVTLEQYILNVIANS